VITPLVYWMRDHVLTEFRDCWEFVRQLELAVYNIELPEILVDYDSDDSKQTRHIKQFRAITTHKEREHWHAITSPRGGCLVTMSHNITPYHIGVWVELDGGAVAHYLPELGMQFQTIMRAKAAGWRGLTFYEYV
jgi:hypothetical protein